MTELRTERLILRRWRESDLAPFAALNADAHTMRFFARTLDRAESDAMVARTEAEFDAHGFGFWAVEAPGVAAFIGLVGLRQVALAVPFAPALEIGWRLGSAFWGRGYAVEAARRALRFAFDELGVDEVVAFTSVPNAPSRRVMERLGMTRDPADDFDHPNVPEGHAMRRCVLYRVRATRPG